MQLHPCVKRQILWLTSLRRPFNSQTSPGEVLISNPCPSPGAFFFFGLGWLFPPRAGSWSTWREQEPGAVRLTPAQGSEEADVCQVIWTRPPLLPFKYGPFFLQRGFLGFFFFWSFWSPLKNASYMLNKFTSGTGRTWDKISRQFLGLWPRAFNLTVTSRSLQSCTEITLSYVSH